MVVGEKRGGYSPTCLGIRVSVIKNGSHISLAIHVGCLYLCLMNALLKACGKLEFKNKVKFP